MITFRFLTPALLVASVCLTSTGKADEKPTDDRVSMKFMTLELNVPATWKESDNQSRMRLTTLDIPPAEKGGAKAELGVFYFQGGGGGLKANVDRWKDQFAAEGRKQSVRKGKAGDNEYVIVELSGTYNKSVGPPIMRKTEPFEGYRMLGVILTIEDKVYYLKLTGEDATVKKVAEDFRASFGGDSKTEKDADL